MKLAGVTPTVGGESGNLFRGTLAFSSAEVKGRDCMKGSAER